MACGSCNRKREAKAEATRGIYDIMGGHKHLPNRQLVARLEVFKKRHCSSCDARYTCDYSTYLVCEIRPK